MFEHELKRHSHWIVPYYVWNQAKSYQNSLTRSRTSNLTSGSFSWFSLESRFSACFRNSIFFLLDRKYTVSRVNTQTVSFNSYPNNQFYMWPMFEREIKIQRNYNTDRKITNFTIETSFILIVLDFCSKIQHKTYVKRYWFTVHRIFVITNRYHETINFWKRVIFRSLRIL